MLGHTLVFCFAVLGKGRESCLVLCLSHMVLELPQLCLFQQRLVWTGSCSRTSVAVLTPGRPSPALGPSAVMFQEQDGCPLPPEVTGSSPACLFPGKYYFSSDLACSNYRFKLVLVYPVILCTHSESLGKKLIPLVRSIVRNLLCFSMQYPLYPASFSPEKEFAISAACSELASER